MAAPTGPALPLLPTTVVGSYSVPDWLDGLKTDFYRRRISHAQLEEAQTTAIKAAIKDQERVGIDVISDGELRRDNDVDYLLARLPGVRLDVAAKTRHHVDYADAELVELPDGDAAQRIGLVEDYQYTRSQTDLPVKFSFTGPFSLSRRLRNSTGRSEEDVVLALARVLNAEARSLVAAGATMLQVDEPFLAGYRDRVELAAAAVDVVFDGVEATRMLHVCWGNRYARPLWQGHYDFLFPAVLRTRIDQLVLEFARTGYDDLALFDQHAPDFMLGLGVVDVKSETIEPAEAVAARIRRALAVLPPERLMVNPDCGLRHLPTQVALGKLRAMVAGAATVRAELAGATTSSNTSA